MSNENLARTVKDELRWDPQIKRVSFVVGADDGVVTLRGSVGSLREPTIDASVLDGHVALSGTADWKYQRDEAVSLRPTSRAGERGRPAAFTGSPR
jgi:osmotically-inducible protein OsmY